MGLICIVVVQFLVLIFKLHNVAQNDYEQIFKAVFDSLHCVMVSARLFQGKCLMDFLRREYIKLTTSLSFNSELDKMLTVGQLFVTEENICKYD